MLPKVVYIGDTCSNLICYMENYMRPRWLTHVTKPSDTFASKLSGALVYTAQAKALF